MAKTMFPSPQHSFDIPLRSKSEFKKEVKEYHKFKLIAIIIAAAAGLATITYSLIDSKMIFSIVKNTRWAAILNLVLPISSAILGGIIGFFSESKRRPQKTK